jgi:hypothetical protein
VHAPPGKTRTAGKSASSPGHNKTSTAQSDQATLVAPPSQAAQATGVPPVQAAPATGVPPGQAKKANSTPAN